MKSMIKFNTNLYSFSMLIFLALLGCRSQSSSLIPPGKEERTFVIQFEQRASLAEMVQGYRERLEQMGIKNFEIRETSLNEFKIHVRKVSSVELLQRILSVRGKIEFRLVDQEASIFREVHTALPSDEKSQLELDPVQNMLQSKNRELLEKVCHQIQKKIPSNLSKSIGFQKKGEWIQAYLLDPAILENRDLKEVKIVQEENSGTELLLEFAPDGARRLGELTEKNRGKILAVLLDEGIFMTPVVRDKITEGKVRVTFGRGSEEDFLPLEAYPILFRLKPLPAKPILIEVQR